MDEEILHSTLYINEVNTHWIIVSRSQDLVQVSGA